MSTIRTQLALHARHHPRRPQRHARLLERAGARRQVGPLRRPGAVLRGHLLEGRRDGRGVEHGPHHGRSPERAQHQDVEQRRAAQEHPRRRAQRLHRRRHPDGRRHGGGRRRLSERKPALTINN